MSASGLQHSFAATAPAAAAAPDALNLDLLRLPILKTPFTVESGSSHYSVSYLPTFAGVSLSRYFSLRAGARRFDQLIRAYCQLN